MGSALLTEVEAAQRLHVSPRLLRDLRSKGHIRYVALSARRIAYRPEDCDAYVESRVKVADPCGNGKPKGGKRRQQSPATGKIIPFSQQMAGRG